MSRKKNRTLIGFVCGCAAFTMAGQVTAFAGPSTGFESEMVAEAVADVSIYSQEDEGSDVVAMAQKGTSMEVVEQGDGDWIKVATGEVEGYLRIQSDVVLSKAEEAVNGLSEAAADLIEAQENGSTRQQVVNYALQFVGGRYRYGGNDPHTGVDCSGFTRYVMQNAAGVSLSRSSGSQAGQGRTVSAQEMQPGDLIFYGNGSRINHVAIYIGEGQIVHASTERTGIKTSNWNYRNPVKIVSVLG